MREIERRNRELRVVRYKEKEKRERERERENR